MHMCALRVTMELNKLSAAGGMSHVTRVTRHTSHVTCHTSHVTSHTSRITRCYQHDASCRKYKRLFAVAAGAITYTQIHTHTHAHTHAHTHTHTCTHTHTHTRSNSRSPKDVCKLKRGDEARNLTLLLPILSQVAAAAFRFCVG